MTCEILSAKLYEMDGAFERLRFIDRQLERAAITSISGFGKIMPEASKVLVIG